ncbi:MAG: hypothetical protein IAF00_07210 [Phycisphaerales bacterium]|nr:hypothetical protein [Phycisphaerales bacterium]
MSQTSQRWRYLPLLVLTGLLATTSVSAQSDYRQQGNDERRSSLRQSADPDRAANAARQATGGRVLGVQGTERDGRPGYQVRILQQDGRVRSLHYDSSSGAMRD